MSPKKTILIAEDHTILREGLRSLLNTDQDFEVVGEAEDGREANARSCPDGSDNAQNERA